MPPSSLDELLLFACLSLLLPASLEREFVPYLLATDVCTCFDFGLSGRPCDEGTLLELAALSETRGDYVTFTDSTRQPFKLPFAMGSFTDLLSMRATHPGHAGQLEAHGFLLLLQWVLRSASRFSSRITTLIDAKVLIYILLKGRSSGPTLNFIVRSIAAHGLAEGLLVYPLYTPSEWNPADAPSRGARRRERQHRGTRPHKPSTLEKSLGRRERAMFHLMKSGTLTPHSEWSTDSASS